MAPSVKASGRLGVRIPAYVVKRGIESFTATRSAIGVKNSHCSMAITAEHRP